MAQIPFCGPTYNGRSVNIDASRAVNWYPEITGTQDNKTMLNMVGTPGTRLFATAWGEAPVRAMHVMGDRLFVVIDSKLYESSTTGTLTTRGSLSTSTGRVCMSDNGIAQTGVTGVVGGNQLMIVDGTDGYILNVSTNSFYTISSTGGYGTMDLGVTFQDTGDTCTLHNHGLVADTPIKFTYIAGTTGISIDTTYYVKSPATNTFQLAATIGGSALPLTNNGIGHIDPTTVAAKSVTFTNSTSSVNLAANGLGSGDVVFFSELHNSFGFYLYTPYYVVTTGTNSFKLSATVGGSPVVIDSGAWPDILDASTYGPLSLTYQDGYFILTNGSMAFWVSNLYDGTSWNALAYGAATASHDAIVGVIAHHQQLFVVKTHTTEVWYNAGIPTTQGSPFLRMSGGVFDYGTVSQWTLARGGGSLFFLATSRINSNGEALGVAMVTDYAPQVISTPAINYRITNSTNLSNCFGYCYSESGHVFYVLTNPDDNWTLVYDATTSMWHERSSFGSDTITVPRHVSNCYAYFNKKHYVGDYRSSTVYEMSPEFLSDNGVPIWSFRTAQTIFDKNELLDVFINLLAVDMETGVGTPESSIVSSTIYPAGDDHTYNNRPTVTGTDISATSFGFIASGASTFDGIVSGDLIKVTGFSDNSINTKATPASEHNSDPGPVQYVVSSVTSKTLVTTIAPLATESEGNLVTLYAFENLLRVADGTTIAGAVNSGLVVSGNIYPAGDDHVTASRPTVTSNDIAATATGFTSVASLPTMATASKIFVSGFTTHPEINTDYTLTSFGTHALATSPVPLATETAGANVTLYNYKDVLIKADGTITAGAISYIVTAPNAYLSWSNDGGHTWSNEYAAPLGADKAYSTRLRWRRLGRSNNRVFKLRVSDPVKRNLLNAYVEAAT